MQITYIKAGFDVENKKNVNVSRRQVLRRRRGRRGRRAVRLPGGGGRRRVPAPAARPSALRCASSTVILSLSNCAPIAVKTKDIFFFFCAYFLTHYAPNIHNRLKINIVLSLNFYCI